MKTKYLLTIIVVFSSVILKAQDSRFSIGAFSGTNLYFSKSTLDNDPIKVKPRPGFELGISTSFHFSNKLSFTLKGSFLKIQTYEDHNYIGVDPEDLTLPEYSKSIVDFYNVGISTQYSFITNDKINLYGTFGGNFSNLATHAQDVHYANREDRMNYSTKMSPLSLQYGLGLGKKLSEQTTLTFEVTHRINNESLIVMPARSSNMLNFHLGIHYRI
ncbi:MAG: outer membrane beta-barrel protein [Bacteroidia bacterium]